MAAVISSSSTPGTSGDSKNLALCMCTKCHRRYRFEELSGSQQLCRECRGSSRTVKCTYCRSEFNQESRESKLQTVCTKCEKLKDKHGAPTACKYCNIIAAFIGNKCQRCAISEERYGEPQDCEMCKQRCAFDRKDPEHSRKLDGKLLCWLCTISMKRALAKANQNKASIRHTSISSPKSSSKDNQKDKNHSRESKRPRLDSKSNGNKEATSTQSDTLGLRTGSTDQFNIVAIGQLREQITTLQRQLQRKDQELLEKDKKIAEMTANFRREEREWREKFQTDQKKMMEKIESYQQKISQLQKQNATLSKQLKKPAASRAPDSPADSPLL